MILVVESSIVVYYFDCHIDLKNIEASTTRFSSTNKGQPPDSVDITQNIGSN